MTVALFNKMNQTLTTYLDKVQILVLRFIGFGEKKKFPRLIFATDTAFFQNVSLERRLLSLIL